MMLEIILACFFVPAVLVGAQEAPAGTETPAPVPVTAATCQEVYELFNNNAFLVNQCTKQNNHLYWRIDSLLTWHEASRACQTLTNGYLASVHNFDEEIIVQNLASQEPLSTDTSGSRAVWIGYAREDMDCNKQFIWSDGSSNKLARSERVYENFFYKPDCHTHGGKDLCVAAGWFAANNDLDWKTKLGFGWASWDCDGRKFAAVCKQAVEAFFV